MARDLVSCLRATAPFCVAVGCSSPSPATGPAHAAHAADAVADHRHGPHAEGMPHRFDDADRWAAVFDDPDRDAWQQPEAVIGALDLTAGMTVADVGAGTGYFVGRLSAAVGARGQVIATDVEADMIRYLDERSARDGWTNVRSRQVAAGDPGLDPGSVDRVLVVDVWHHLADRHAYAARLAAALRPGGRIVIVDFTLEAERGPPRHLRLGADAIVAELGAAGLVADVAAEELPDQYIVVARLAPEGRPK